MGPEDSTSLSTPIPAPSTCLPSSSRMEGFAVIIQTVNSNFSRMKGKAHFTTRLGLMFVLPECSGVEPLCIYMSGGVWIGGTSRYTEVYCSSHKFYFSVMSIISKRLQGQTHSYDLS